MLLVLIQLKGMLLTNCSFVLFLLTHIEIDFLDNSHGNNVIIVNDYKPAKWFAILISFDDNVLLGDHLDDPCITF